MASSLWMEISVAGLLLIFRFYVVMGVVPEHEDLVEGGISEG